MSNTNKRVFTDNSLSTLIDNIKSGDEQTLLSAKQYSDSIKNDLNLNAITQQALCDHTVEITGNTGDEHGLAIQDQQMLINRIEGQSVIIDGAFAHSNCNLISTGRNLWDEEWEIGSLNSSGQNAESSSYTRIRSKNYIRVIPNIIYYTRTQLTIHEYDINKNLIRYRNSIYGVFELDENTCYIKFRNGDEYGTVYKNDICINVSDTNFNGTYEPYKKEAISDIGELKAFDYINNINGNKVIATKEKVISANDVSLGSSDYVNIVYYRFAKPDDYIGKGSYTGRFLTNKYVEKTSGTWDSVENIGYIFKNAQGGSFWIGFPTGTTLEQAKTEINGITLLYEATPTEEDINLPAGYAVYKNGYQIQEGEVPYVLTKEYSLNLKAQVLANIEVDREQQEQIDIVKNDISEITDRIDNDYHTKTEVNNLLDSKAPVEHTHDDIYYTEIEIDTKLSNKANSSHTHTVANITDLTATATELNYMDGVTSNIQTQLDRKAALSHNHINLNGWSDTRNVDTTPNDYNSKFAVSGLKANSTIGSPDDSTYSGVVGFRSWSDKSGGNAHELAFTGNGDLYRRHGATTEWGDWVQFIDSGNIGSQSVASATKATQDASGNVITSTYATKTELETEKENLQTAINEKASSSHTHSSFPNDIYFGGDCDFDGVLTYMRDEVAVKGDIPSYITTGAKSGTTIGTSATAEGYNTTASGESSHAEGRNTTASGAYSHAEGYNTTASESSSHAEGSDTTALGVYSHAEGWDTTATQTCSHAEGYGTTAFGMYSHAEGYGTTASGAYSHAEGYNTTASGTSSHAGGYGTTANNYQYVVGKYNTDTTAPTSIIDKTASAGLFIVGIGTDESSRSNGFRINPAGKVYGTGTFGTSGADYAEYFEWFDGNPDNEDRRGHFVALEGDKIRYATPNDDYILGVVSADPSVAGDVYSEDWHNRYLKDVFGSKIVEVVEVEETTNEDGEIIPVHTERRWVLNPDYNPNVKYTSREERPEWAAIGIVGKLVVVDDGTCQVNGYCYPNANGIATTSQKRTNYRVMERLDDTHIRIFIK